MISLSLLLGLKALLLQDGTLTLEEAISLAESQAVSIRLAQSNYEEAKANEKVAKARLGPGAQVVASASYFDPLGTTTSFGPSSSQFSTGIQLQVSQLIDLSGVTRDRVRSAEYTTKAQAASIEVAKNDVRGLVKQKYFAILQAQELLTVAEASLKSTQERLDKANIRFREGAISGFDVVRLEADVKKAEQQVIDAKLGVELAKNDLNNLLARPIDTPFQVVPPTSAMGEIPGVADLVAKSVSTRPELKQGELVVKALEQARRAEEKAGRPSLNVTGTVSKNFEPGFGQSGQSATVGASLSIPIVTGGAVEANARSAKEREERAKIQLEQIQLGVALEVHNAASRLRSAWEAYTTAQANVAVAKEAVRLAELRYDEQVGTLSDVITAQASLTQAMAAETNALFQVRTAYAALQKAVGSEDVGPGLNAAKEKGD